MPLWDSSGITVYKEFKLRKNQTHERLKQREYHLR